jgi:hypothetical protein
VLHTRVSENLADDIRRIADDLRVPASNLVRNVLEEVFDVVESVSGDVGKLFDEVLVEADAARERLERRRGAGRPRADRAAWDAARAEVEEADRSDAPPPPPPVEWHVVDKQRSVGPRDHAWLRREVLAGRLGRDTLVWCAGLSDWQPAGEVPALAGLFAPPPVPGASPAPSEAPGEPGTES